MTTASWLGASTLVPVEDDGYDDLLWDDADAASDSEPDEPLDPVEQDPLVEAAVARLPGWLDLLEAAYRWEASKHPRWPKGTKRAGQFIEVGQQFNVGGVLYEVSHLVQTPTGGKMIAQVASGKYHETATREFDVKTVGGEPTVPGIESPKRRSFTAGKGLGLNLPTVDPYVDRKSHDPSLQLPSASKLSAEEWKAFGRVDQEVYIHLMNHFGAWQSQKTHAYMQQAMSEAESTVLGDVKAAYHSQYGSSSGTLFNFAGLVHGITDAFQLEKASQRREERKRVIAEIQAAMQWDLYNRLRAPDMAIFHRDSSHGPHWWQVNFVDGASPVMSGLSNSWKYSKTHMKSWGDTVVATPIAIRQICMANPFVVPVSSGFVNSELEVSYPDGLKLDKRTFVFSENAFASQNPNGQKWLSGMTLDDGAPGRVIDQVRAAIEKGEILPMPAAKPEIKMQGTGGKLWLDPPLDVGSNITLNANGEDLPGPKNVFQLPYATPSGEPNPQPINQLNVQAGDFIEGMQGSRYVILDDPGDTAFPFRYFELNKDGTHMGKSYNFEGGGVKSFKRLDGHYDIPKQKQEGGPLWDPTAWAYGEKKVYVQHAPVGSKFKVNDHPYEVTGKDQYGSVSIKSLETGGAGTINGDYQSTLLVAKEGYVAPTQIEEQHAPTAGVTFAHDGEKYVITKQLKDGKIQAKRWKGSGVVKLDPEDPSLKPENLHDPAAWTIGDTEVKLADLPVGQKFQGGTGTLHQRPYVVLANDGKNVKWRNLDTGVEGETKASKKYRPLVPAQADSYAGAEDAPPNPGAHVPENWLFAKAPSGDAATKKLGELGVGEKFAMAKAVMPGKGVADHTHYEVVAANSESIDVKVLSGPTAGDVIPLPLAQWEGYTDAIPLKPNPAKVKQGPISAFNPSGFTDGPTMKVDDMPVGSVFVGKNGAQYLLVKKGPKSGAVATNLQTGKPYPAIAYSKEFPTLTPKAVAPSVPYEDYTENDFVPIGQLKVGDQFRSDGADLFQVTALSPDNETGPTFAQVTEDGLSQVQSSLGTWPDMPVKFYAHAGQGYDPTKQDLAPVQGAAELPDAVTAAGYAPYKSSAGPGGAYKHHKVSELPKGIVFQDKNGKLWKVQVAGQNPVITDGSTNYAVDGNLRGRTANLSGGMVDAFSKAAGKVPPPGPSSHPDTPFLVVNGAQTSYAHMQVGEHFRPTPSQDVFRIVSKSGHDVVGVSLVTGEHMTWDDAQTPHEIELMKAPKAPKAPSVSPEPQAPEAETLSEPAPNLNAPYSFGGYHSVGTKNHAALQVGDVYSATPEYENKSLWRVTDVSGSGVKIERVWSTVAGGPQTGDVPFNASASVTLFEPDGPKVPPFDPNDYVIKLVSKSAADMKPGDTFYFDQQPYKVRPGQDKMAPSISVDNLETGKVGFVGKDEKVVPITPKPSSAVKKAVGSAPDDKIDHTGLPIYTGGETVHYAGEDWTVTGVAGGGSIVAIKSLSDGHETKIGKGNVSYVAPPPGPSGVLGSELQSGDVVLSDNGKTYTVGQPASPGNPQFAFGEDSDLIMISPSLTYQKVPPPSVAAEPSLPEPSVEEPPEPSVGKPGQDVSGLSQLQLLEQKHGTFDSWPVDLDTTGYKADWGAGGAFRYRPLSWVPDGDLFFSKSGGLWQKVGTVTSGGKTRVLATNSYTGEVRVFPNAYLRVKPPVGVTWK